MSLALPSRHTGPRAELNQRGAYALVRDAGGHVLVVRTREGRCYLPGGRIEPGETPHEALAREIEEECGWRAEVGAALCSGEQRILGGAVRLRAGYWEARLTGPAPREPEHQALWLSPSEAAARLHRASDRRALALSCR